MTNSNDLRALVDLQHDMATFVRQREWQKFHTPKNVSMALTVEAAELQEIFLWIDSQGSSTLSQSQLQRVEEEMADVFLYLLRLSDLLGIDLISASKSKIELNRKKYPIEKVRGKSNKYSEY